MEKLYIIPSRDRIEESLELAAEYGAAFEYNDFYLPELMDDPLLLERAIAFYEALDRDRSRDMLHGAFLDITIHSDDPCIFRASDMRVRQSMDIASRLGVFGVVFHTNFIANFRSRDYRSGWVQKNAEFWSRLIAEYPALNVYIENMFDSEPELLALLAEELKKEERFGVCFDYAHAAVSPTPLSEWTATLAPYVKHLHINDNDLLADLHQEIGTGSIDWEEFDRLMRGSKIHASVLIETADPNKQRRSLEYMQKHRLFPFGSV
ncbi:MAG: sugar phosphate isomerase/epimerase [Clostridia bacterium]|nr:sugar phosphate isomerase/epimerase [Clostridia bacterium]